MNEDHTKALEEVTDDDIRRLAKVMSDLKETKGWQEYSKLVGRMVRVREALVFSPIDSIPTNHQDLTAKMVALESIKGAVIGLRLAIDLPDSIMQHAADIAREKDEVEDA